jgi:hypothetical protein
LNNGQLFHAVRFSNAMISSCHGVSWGAVRPADACDGPIRPVRGSLPVGANGRLSRRRCERSTAGALAWRRPAPKNGTHRWYTAFFAGRRNSRIYWVFCVRRVRGRESHSLRQPRARASAIQHSPLFQRSHNESAQISGMASWTTFCRRAFSDNL